MQRNGRLAQKPVESIRRSSGVSPFSTPPFTPSPSGSQLQGGIGVSLSSTSVVGVPGTSAVAGGGGIHSDGPSRPSVPSKMDVKSAREQTTSSNNNSHHSNDSSGQVSEVVSIRNGHSDRSSDDDSEQFSTSPASSGSWSALVESTSKGSRPALLCCIAERKSDGSYVACPRGASGIWLSEKLRDTSAIKRFPFVYNTARGHYYLCLYHRRVIVNEAALRKGESLKARELTKYEKDVAPTDDELREIADDPLVKIPARHRSRSASSPGEESDFKKRRKTGGKATETGAAHNGSESDESAEYTEERPRRSARNLSNGSGTPQVALVNGKTGSARKEKPKKDDKEEKSAVKGDPCDDHSDNEEPSNSFEVPLKVLSATALRRYKKFFKLSHRSGTNTKPQLLEGVGEHFESLAAPIDETIAYFIYTAKSHRNKLDYPNGSGNSVSASVPEASSSQPIAS